MLPTGPPRSRSVRPAIAQSGYAVARAAARELLGKGSYDTLTTDLDYAEINDVLATPCDCSVHH